MQNLLFIHVTINAPNALHGREHMRQHVRTSLGRVQTPQVWHEFNLLHPVYVAEVAV
jgi:hypothetical protein